MKRTSKIILAGLLLLSMLLQTVPVYAMILGSDLSNEKSETEIVEIEATEKPNVGNATGVEDENEIDESKVVKSGDAVAADETTVTGTWGTSPWEFDPATGVLVIKAGELTAYEDSPWNKTEVAGSDILKITLEGTIVAPVNSSYLFSASNSTYRLNKLKSIENESNLDTSNVTNMYGVFQGAGSLESLDLSGWDTSKVTSMSAMFINATALTNLNMSNLNTSNITDMSSMFVNTSSLKNLDISNWDTSKVTVMNNMFQGAGSLESLDLSGWNTSSVTIMDSMFANTSSLKSLDLSNWNTSSVTKMSSMFSNASSLKSLDLSSWDISNVTAMNYIFYNATSLESLDISSWNTSNIKYIADIFENASSLKTITLGKDFRFIGNTGLANGSYPSSFSWIGENTGKVYNTTQKFTKYDGTNPDKYTRGVARYDVVYMNGDVKLHSDNVSVEDEYKVKDGTDFAIEEKIMISWSENADGKGKEYPFNSKIEVTQGTYKETVTLYAKWKLNEYTVTFEPNGGKFTDKTTEVKAVKVTEGEKVKAEKVEKAKYSFEGWYTDKDLKKAYDFESEVTNDFTLYAKWKATEVTSGKGKLPRAGIVTGGTIIFGLSAIGVGAYFLKKKK